MSMDTQEPLTVRRKLKKKIKLRTHDGERVRRRDEDEGLTGPRPVRIEHSPPIAPRAPSVAMKVITVTPDRVMTPPKERTKRYWVGVTADAPFDNRAFGGVAFQRYSGEIHADPTSGELNLSRANVGNTTELTEYQVRLVCEAVARRVVRTVGDRKDATGNYRCDTVTVTAQGFRPMDGDKPVGIYLYMVEIHEQMPYDWRKTAPPTMVARD